MDAKARQCHWENIYKTKTLTEVSWYQPHPKSSLRLIAQANLDKSAAIIDIGGGDSFLVDYLLREGYTNISVLDISAQALQRAQNRLGKQAELVDWIVADITQFQPQKTYAFWHDRAVFHFLTTAEDIAGYQRLLQQSVAPKAYAGVGTFSVNGPQKCSGLPVTQYSAERLNATFSPPFEVVANFLETHPTPFDTTQEFVFGLYRLK